MEQREPSTKIGWIHDWGVVKWETKSAPWGQGPEGLHQRGERKS